MGGYKVCYFLYDARHEQRTHIRLLRSSLPFCTKTKIQKQHTNKNQHNTNHKMHFYRNSDPFHCRCCRRKHILGSTVHLRDSTDQGQRPGYKQKENSGLLVWMQNTSTFVGKFPINPFAAIIFFLQNLPQLILLNAHVQWI